MRGIGVTPPPLQKNLIGFAHISGVALEESGWVQTHPNPPVASPLAIGPQSGSKFKKKFGTPSLRPEKYAESIGEIRFQIRSQSPDIFAILWPPCLLYPIRRNAASTTTRVAYTLHWAMPRAAISSWEFWDSLYNTFNLSSMVLESSSLSDCSDTSSRHADNEVISFNIHGSVSTTSWKNWHNNINIRGHFVNGINPGARTDGGKTGLGVWYRKVSK